VNVYIDIEEHRDLSFVKTVCQCKIIIEGYTAKKKFQTLTLDD